MYEVMVTALYRASGYSSILRRRARSIVAV